MPAGTMAPESPKNFVTSSACISSSTSQAAAIRPAPKAQPPIWRTNASAVMVPRISACLILSWFIFQTYMSEGNINLLWHWTQRALRPQRAREAEQAAQSHLNSTCATQWPAASMSLLHTAFCRPLAFVPSLLYFSTVAGNVQRLNSKRTIIRTVVSVIEAHGIVKTYGKDQGAQRF